MSSSSGTPSSGKRPSGKRSPGKGASGKAASGKGASAGRGGAGKGGSGKGGGGKGGGGKGGSRGRAPAGGGRPPTEDDPVARLGKPLERVLSRLPETQREVLEWRMGLKDGHPHDLADTARQLGLSMAEARDIEKRAFAHIREAIPLDQLAKYLQA